jgi:hypothetical protein
MKPVLEFNSSFNSDQHYHKAIHTVRSQFIFLYILLHIHDIKKFLIIF